ncbi:MAG: galactokinase [Planctomycetes bacterium]|nr:galactokinase [Planctomycetota bacterium]
MTADPRSRLLDAIAARSRDDFGATGLRCFFAPGRINLVGAHLDYSGGDVMPMAVDRGIYVGVQRNDDGRIRLRSVDQELAVDVGVDEIGDVGEQRWGWGNYPLGIWRSFRRDHGVAAGFDAVFAGDLPMASGLSSSAAIEVVTAIALDALHGTELDRETIASMAHRAENDFVGVRCGIMDQYASALGRAGQVLWMHCQGPRWEHVPFDPDACEVLVMDTRKPRKLAASGFNERVAQCVAAREFLSERVRPERHLAAFTIDDLESVGDAMDPVLYRRARHVVTEMGRIAAGAAALRAHDYAALGAQLDASHRSTAEDYDVSCAELDVITDAARACDGVFGARLTGAGFGGCAIALIAPGHREQVAARVSETFRARFGVQPGFDLLRIGDGPGEILT